jgi:hypothetical protein
MGAGLGLKGFKLTNPIGIDIIRAGEKNATQG